MADCVDDRHVTSDEYLDPRCEPCFDSKKRSVHVYGYCHECYKFMCTDCHFIHEQFPLAKNHVIVRGSNMPKSLADKPPKYERCDDHPRQWKDLFCCDHKELVCSTYSDINHKTCLTKSVDGVCKSIPSSAINALCDAVKNLSTKAKSVKDSIEMDIEDFAEQQDHLMKEIQTLHESAISKVNELFQNILSEAIAEYQFQNEHLNENKEKITDIETQIEGALDEIKKQNRNPFDAKLFLKMYECVQSINQTANDLKTLTLSRRLVLLSFDHSNLAKEITSDSAHFGSLKKEEFKPELIEINDIIFPLSDPPNAQSVQVIARPKGIQGSPILPVPIQVTGISGQSTTVRQPTVPSSVVACTQPQKQSPDATQRQDDDEPVETNQPIGNATARSRSMVIPDLLSQIKATKQNTYNIKVTGEDSDCWISGMAIKKDNKILLVDSNHNKVKLFWPNMKFLNSVSVRASPCEIALITDETAAVTTNYEALVIMDISGRKLSGRKRSVPLDYITSGISPYKNRIVVTCSYTYPPSVKLIGLTGRVYWSVSTDLQGRQLFEWPMAVCCLGNGVTSTMVMTDAEKNTVTLLKAETGEVVTTRQLEEHKEPRGVTTDTAGNVYVCYWGRCEVSVLTRDLSEEKILLTEQDGLGGRSEAIVYDETRKKLIVSYFQKNSIDCFQLS